MVSVSAVVGFFVYFVSCERQECLFLLYSNFLQPNADMPYNRF